MDYATPQLLVDRLGRNRVLLTTMLLIACIAVLDYASGYELRLAALYLAPIMIATWAGGMLAGIVAAASACLLWLLSFKWGHYYLSRTSYFWEAAVMLCSFLAFAWLTARLRRALDQADARFVRVLEEMHAAVYVVDRQRDRILYANPRMLQLSGDAAAPSPSDFERRFACEAEDGNTLRDTRDGRWYLCQEGPIPWGSNAAARLRVLTDITAHRQAELLRERHAETMHQTARLTSLAEIASTLAHEINQPLMAITTYMDASQRLLEARDFDPREISTVLGKCRQQAVRAASTIQRLREFIRQRQFRPSPCEAQSLVAETLDLMRPLLDDSGANIDVSGVAPGLRFPADRVLLVQILDNLIRNAIDAMRDLPVDDRRLTIAASISTPGTVRFSVADRGPGIGVADTEKMFTPFFTTKEDGLGLGLAICRSLAEAHGGQLWMEAGQPGAVFHLDLPMEPAAS